MTATAIRERPIMFSGPMIQAILAGAKTQTRRAMKKQPPGGYEPHIATDFVSGKFRNGYALWQPGCPYGGPGDRLWVRETFAPRADVDPKGEPEKARHYCLYAADGSDPRDSGHWHDYGGRWKPSIFMPRELSRITLEVDDVRAQRLRAISEADAKAEGGGTLGLHGSPRDQFAHLWDAINGKRAGCSWADDPWVWVIEFRRIESEVAR